LSRKVKWDFSFKNEHIKKKEKRNEIGFKNAGLIKKQLDLKQM